MKKSELVKLIREMVAQHPVHQRINDKLLQIAKRGADAEERERYVGDPKKGNKVLDKANPENVSKILKGEKPVYEAEGDTMNLTQLIDYIKDLSPDTQLWVPTIFPGGFGKDQTTRRTVEQAVKELTDVLGSKDHNQTQFKLSQDNPKFKSFSVIISPEEMKRREDMIRSMGSLD